MQRSADLANQVHASCISVLESRVFTGWAS